MYSSFLHILGLGDCGKNACEKAVGSSTVQLDMGEYEKKY